MKKEELLKFCLEKSILLDKDLLEVFSEASNFETVKLIIERVKTKSHKNFITKEVLQSNKYFLKNFLSENSKNNDKLRELKIKLGLNLEISTKTTNSFEKPNEFKENKVKVSSSSCPTFGRALCVKDFVNYFRNRFNDLRVILEENPKLKNLVSINRISGSRGNFSIIGIILEKRISKNKNIILEVEDLTGKVRILFSPQNSEVYEKAENIALDSVLGFNCSGNGNFLFGKDIFFPEASLSSRKKSPVEEYALFIGDIHYGSKNFMEKEFLNFIKYLNDLKNSEVAKIKYLFVIGDIVTGVGNYPNQEKDLVIGDLESQFQNLAILLDKIRKDIKIIICPGNHDGVRLMEPQPIFDEKYAWPLYDLKNVILVENPSHINIANRGSFEGFEILMYHGFSFPYYANNISSLISEKSMNSPEKIMKYLLVNRHLAPTHSSVQSYPCEKDPHLIKVVPDIFVSGHTHKSGVFYHNNVLIISISTWESFTPYQEKFGNKADYCKVPMINLKTRAVKILDFEEDKSGGENEDRN